MASIVSKRTMACRRGYQPFRFSSLCRFTKYALSSHGNSMTTFAVLNHVPMQFPFLLPKIAFCFARRATVTSTMNAMSGVCGSSSSVECVFLNQIRNLLALSANHQLGAYSLVIAQAFACVCMPLGCVVVS